MTPRIKQMLFGSILLSLVVGVLAVVDIFMQFPFAGQIVLDVMFLLSAGLIAYMGFDTYKELT